MPLVSVILPTRDRRALLPRAVESVLSQTERDLEVVLVDNNRSEPPVAEGHAGANWLTDPRIRIMAGGDAQNAAAARNVGLARATGEFITYLDDDDAYRAEKVARQVERLRADNAPIVLCGAAYHLDGRVREVQCETATWVGDELLLTARWGTPLMLHRSEPSLRFDEALSAGEDLHFAQQAIAFWDIRCVPNVPAPLLDIFQDGPFRPRTNLRAAPGWQAARRTWWEFGHRYTPKARRLFVLRALITRAKLEGSPAACFALAPSLLRIGGTAQLRFVLNAWVVAAGLGRGRWVT